MSDLCSAKACAIDDRSLTPSHSSSSSFWVVSMALMGCDTDEKQHATQEGTGLGLERVDSRWEEFAPLASHHAMLRITSIARESILRQPQVESRTNRVRGNTRAQKCKCRSRNIPLHKQDINSISRNKTKQNKGKRAYKQLARSQHQHQPRHSTAALVQGHSLPFPPMPFPCNTLPLAPALVSASA